MRNEFMAAAHQAMRQLRSAQSSHARIRERADSRLREAQQRHAEDVARAEMVEAQGWVALLNVPGLTIPTAAALLQVSEATVSRWVSRYNRSVDEQARPAGGSRP